ncbi:hypothetical protein GHT07_07390 [Caenimonas koreensis DSM 17982]|uniref:Uncharacterized protein n=1 Tax=Caenimonas koreensis DSM 17982 TaxID=1121255 RepID=A0A844B6G3_9BURK|nr:hypothetical protein [Caenimonas koreensis DSM 17982]
MTTGAFVREPGDIGQFIAACARSLQNRCHRLDGEGVKQPAHSRAVGGLRGERCSDSAQQQAKRRRLRFFDARQHVRLVNGGSKQASDVVLRYRRDGGCADGRGEPVRQVRGARRRLIAFQLEHDSALEWQAESTMELAQR